MYPFHEQATNLAAHEDVLLLGPAKHVMLTPCCVRSIGAGSLGAGGTEVALLDSEGSPIEKVSCHGGMRRGHVLGACGRGMMHGQGAWWMGMGIQLTHACTLPPRQVVPASKLPSAATFRLYLTWGHKDSPFHEEVAPFERPLSQMMAEQREESVWSRASRFLQTKVGGRIQPPEQWMRYPGAPVDPAYYNDLLAKVGFHGSEEKAARTLSRASFTNRGVAAIGSAVPGSVQIEIEKSDLAETTTFDA